MLAPKQRVSEKGKEKAHRKTQKDMQKDTQKDKKALISFGPIGPAALLLAQILLNIIVHRINQLIIIIGLLHYIIIIGVLI
jgi:hypothetical protein